MFRIGTTSYIYPADILTNARRLAGRVQDIELVLFEFDGETNFPDDAVLEELADLGRTYQMSYTIHLPLDLALAGKKADTEKAIRVIGLTRGLHPAGYVVHLDEHEQLDETTRLTNSLASLRTIASAVEDCGLICVENLENQPTDFIDRILEAMPVSACTDVGHLWKRNEDPASVLGKRLDRTRIVHIHGLQGRDHSSLSYAAPCDLDPVVELLMLNYSGVLTIEVFSELDFSSSYDALLSSIARVSGNHSSGGGSPF